MSFADKERKKKILLFSRACLWARDRRKCIYCFGRKWLIVAASVPFPKLEGRKCFEKGRFVPKHFIPLPPRQRECIVKILLSFRILSSLITSGSRKIEYGMHCARPSRPPLVVLAIFHSWMEADAFFHVFELKWLLHNYLSTYPHLILRPMQKYDASRKTKISREREEGLSFSIFTDCSCSLAAIFTYTGHMALAKHMGPIIK